MNSQNEDENDMDSDFVKDKYKTRPSEATEETKKGKTSPKESEPTYQFQGHSTRSQHCFNLDTGCIEDNFATRKHGFSKYYILNMFQVKPIRIGLHFRS